VTGAEELVQRRDPRPGIVELVLNRPQRLNALTTTLVHQLHDQLRAIAADPGCRVVVITGAGRGFCAGLDLDGYGDPPGAEDEGIVHRGWRIQTEIAAIVQRIRRLPQPVIARVNGPAAGGGFALVCASDLRLAATTATFTSSFIRIGVSGCDIGTSWLLPRLVGAARAHELMLTSRTVHSDEALRIGLVTTVVAPADLDAAVDATLDALLAAPPLSLSLTKQGMWTALEIPSFDAAIELENRQQVLTFATADADEARTARREGRAAHYLRR
jgi:enoyl-CoA hydratase/carnithine racemase